MEFVFISLLRGTDFASISVTVCIQVMVISLLDMELTLASLLVSIHIVFTFRLVGMKLMMTVFLVFTEDISNPLKISVPSVFIFPFTGKASMVFRLSGMGFMSSFRMIGMEFMSIFRMIDMEFMVILCTLDPLVDHRRRTVVSVH